MNGQFRYFPIISGFLTLLDWILRRIGLSCVFVVTGIVTCRVRAQNAASGNVAQLAAIWHRDLVENFTLRPFSGGTLAENGSVKHFGKMLHALSLCKRNRLPKSVKHVKQFSHCLHSVREIFLLSHAHVKVEKCFTCFTLFCKSR